MIVGPVMKVGDKVKVKGSSDDHLAIVTRVDWRGAAGSGVSYVQSVEIAYENGMRTTVQPSSIEIINAEQP